MKKSTLFFAALLCTGTIFSQTFQEISVGAGYQKQSFIKLSGDSETQANNTSWDIAFSVFGFQDGGIFINESAGTSMGQPQPSPEVYYALTDNFDEQPDPTALEDFPLFNAEASWANGAFNEVRDTLNGLDYGWGEYNFITHQIVGTSVYVIKLRDGSYRKFKVESLAGSTYTFKYANLDGTNLITQTINKADHAGKTLAYFSFDSGSTVAVEPDGGFDLLYCRYITPLFDPGSMTYLAYPVTGVLTGEGVQVAKADGVNPETVAYTAYQDSLQTRLDVIGYDWKTFTGAAWTLDLDRVFFVKTADDHVWKVQFVDFEGSSTGVAVLTKEDLGVISAVQNPAAIGMKAMMYPNPVQERLLVSLDIPAGLGKDAQLLVTDMSGRLVAQHATTLNEGFSVLELPAQTWATGAYVLHLKIGAQEVNLGKVIKQ